MFPLRRFWKNITPEPANRQAAAKRRSRTGFRPHLEPLEDRLAPATHVWSGAFSSLWSDDRNWSSGGSPYGDGGDAVVLLFPSSGVARFTSTHDRQEVVRVSSLIFFGGDGFTVNGNSITLLG